MLRGLLDSLAASVSLELQRGVPLFAYVERLALARFEPAGWTDSELGYAHSVVDYVARWWLGLRFAEAGAVDQPAEVSQGETCPVCGGAVTWDPGSPCPVCGDRARARRFGPSPHETPRATVRGLERRMTERERQLQAEVERLTALINTPLLDDFSEAVVREAAHQVERWGASHDASKEPQDWFWTLAYLAGKAMRAHIEGNREKALHHTISSAALLLNWHLRILAGQPRSDAAKPTACRQRPELKAATPSSPRSSG